MSDLYAKHAVKYDQVIQENIYNAMYDFYTMKNLIGDVTGLDIVDIGCGSGVYAQYFLEQKAGEITCIDYSAEMIKLVEEKLGERVSAYASDVSQGIAMVETNSADLVVSALMLHYIEDLNLLFADINRVLKSGGRFVFSTHHPFPDLASSLTGNYFQREKIKDTWDTVGEPVEVQFYRRSLTEFTQALRNHGFMISEISEGEVAPQAKDLCEKTYRYLTTQPNFLFVSAVKV